MSRLYFHSPSGNAGVTGAEHYHLRAKVDAIAVPLWRTGDLHDIKDLLDLVPRDPRADYAHLHIQLDKALTEHERNQALWAEPNRRGVPATRHEEISALRSRLQLHLKLYSIPLEVAGVRLKSACVELNTALIAGSDPIRLAAKVTAWGEKHAWVAGPDRAWMADLIDKGLKAGIYQRGLWYLDRSCDGLPKDQPDRKWAETGWEQVVELLRSRDDEPVVMSHSRDEGFPNQHIAGWGYHDDPEAESEAWYELPEPEQWRLAMAGLTRARPWAQLTPDLGYWTFETGVTIYDLYAPDREQRVAAAAAEDDRPDEHTTTTSPGDR